MGDKCNCTILVFYLCWSQEDSTRHLDFASRSVVRSIDLAVLAELSQDLAGLQRVPPHVVSMADINKSNKEVTEILWSICVLSSKDNLTKPSFQKTRITLLNTVLFS